MPYIDQETSKELDQLKRFIDTHGSTVSNALRVYSERMRKDGERTLAEYAHVSQCPMARDRLEQPDKEGRLSIMTVEGLRISGEMIVQAADRADDAYNALEFVKNGPEEDA